MELTPDILGAGFVGLVVILGAIGQYLRSLRQPAKQDPVLAGVGLELGTREQTERLIAAINRVADVLSDKNTAGINDRLEGLTEQVERLLEEDRRKPRR